MNVEFKFEVGQIVSPKTSYGQSAIIIARFAEEWGDGAVLKTYKVTSWGYNINGSVHECELETLDESRARLEGRINERATT